MLSIEQCKKHLKNCDYTEQQIEEIRDSLHQLASILVEKYLDKKRKDGWQRDNHREPKN
jgi:hypothetical protein